MVLDCVGLDSTLALSAADARSLGDVTLVGIGGGSLAFNFFATPFEVNLQTTYWGSRPELAEVLLLGARGLLTPKVTTYSLDSAAAAYVDLLGGRLEGRAVIVP